MEGVDLIESLIVASGLPRSPLLRELERLMKEAKTSQNEVTLDKLRDILECYLKDVLVEAKTAQN